MELKVGFVCDRGLNPKRPVNQDRFLSIPERGLFAVFDGVGGQQAGEVASQTAADTIEEALAHIQADSSADLIRRAIRFANRDIFEMAESNPLYKTMATTVALVHINGDRATVAHVGDSRVYRLENARLYRETIDHTDIDDDIRAGLIAWEKAAQQGDRNVINRALGVEPDVDVEMKTIRVLDGTRLLLCSDGIYKHLDDDELARMLIESEDPQRAADELKRVVCERGADDNLTAVVVQVGCANKTVKAASGEKAHRARQSIEASAAGSSASGHDRARSGRIQVDFGSGARSERRDSESREASERRAQTSKSQGPETGERKSALRIAMYVLMALVLAAGSFYSGLRASEFVNKPSSEPTATGNGTDPLQSGREAFGRGDYQAAITQFDSVSKNKPENPEAHYWLGRAQIERREFLKAAQSFERTIELQPALDDAYLQAAAAYEAAGDKIKATRMLSRYGEAKRKVE